MALLWQSYLERFELGLRFSDLSLDDFNECLVLEPLPARFIVKAALALTSAICFFPAIGVRVDMDLLDVLLTLLFSLSHFDSCSADE